MLVFLIFYAIYYVIVKKIFMILIFASYDWGAFFAVFATLHLSKNAAIWAWAIWQLTIEFIPLLLFLCKKTKDSCCIISTIVAPLLVVVICVLCGEVGNSYGYNQERWFNQPEARIVLLPDIEEKVQPIYSGNDFTNINEAYREYDIINMLGAYNEKIDEEQTYEIVYYWRDYYYRRMMAGFVFDKETEELTRMHYGVAAEQ